tara:strand:+ start:1801 stop:3036 length:1236 start_codon:yes stop_codon:yes gene_type:complete
MNNDRIISSDWVSEVRRNLKGDTDLLALSLFLGLSLFEFHFLFLFLVAFAGINHVQKEKISLKFDKAYAAIFVTFSIISISTAINNEGIVSILIAFALFAVFNIFYSVYINTSKESFLIAGLIILFSFIFLEIKIIWTWFHNIDSNPSELVYFLESPLLVVPNDIAYMIGIFPFIHLIETSSIKYKKVKTAFMCFNCILFFLASVALESRLSIALLSLFILFSFFKKFSSKWVLFLLSGTVFFGLFFGVTFLLGKPLEVFGTRLTLWYAGFEGIIENPITGHGFDSFGAYYEQFKASVQENELSFLAVDQRYIPWPHNFFIGLVFSFGILIMFPIIILMANIFVKGRKLLSFNDPVVMSMILFLIVSLLEVTYLRPATIFIIAILCALLKNKNIVLNSSKKNKMILSSGKS